MVETKIQTDLIRSLCLVNDGLDPLEVEHLVVVMRHLTYYLMTMKIDYLTLKVEQHIDEIFGNVKIIQFDGG